MLFPWAGLIELILHLENSYSFLETNPYNLPSVKCPYHFIPPHVSSKGKQ